LFKGLSVFSMSSSRVIGGTIAVHLPIVLASHGESLLAAFVCGSVVKIVSTRTGLTLHSLAPLAVALSSHSLASDHTESLVGLYANVANPRQLVVATSSARLLFYDIEDGVLLRQTHITGLAKQTTVARVVASGDHVFFFASNATKALFLYSLNMTSFEASVLHALPNGSEFSGVAASPTGDFVAWWHRNDVFVFEAKRSAVSVRTHKSEVQAACFHPRRPLLAIGDRTGRILIWHALDGAGSPVVEQMHWHAHGVNSLLYTGEDGNILLSGGVEDAVVVWQLETHRKLFVPHLGSLGVFSLASSPNGRSYACVCADNSLFVISSHDLRVSKRILGLRTMGPNLMRT
jgi:WD40 repeat protein